jgi:hypothetical protein
LKTNCPLPTGIPVVTVLVVVLVVILVWALVPVLVEALVAAVVTPFCERGTEHPHTIMVKIRITQKRDVSPVFMQSRIGYAG